MQVDVRRFWVAPNGKRSKIFRGTISLAEQVTKDPVRQGLSP